MATNQRQLRGEHLRLPVASGVLSGAPSVCGNIPLVAETDRASDGTVQANLEGTWAMAVNGVDQSGNSAVAAGDILYFTQGDTIKLSKKNTGVRWGYAVDTDPANAVGTAPTSPLIASGSNGTILVKVGY